MNFLAHQYLSFSIQPFMVGNFIADTVKGNQYLQYNTHVANGILLHRFIDTFTDEHLATKNAIKLIRPYFGKFSTIAIDLYYDYFLAKNWSQFSEQNLSEFAQHVYKTLHENQHQLNTTSSTILRYMSSQNWLLHYGNYEGINKAFIGMQRRTQHDTGFEHALTALHENEKDLEICFYELIQEITVATKNKIELLQNSVIA